MRKLVALVAFLQFTSHIPALSAVLVLPHVALIALATNAVRTLYCLCRFSLNLQQLPTFCSLF